MTIEKSSHTETCKKFTLIEHLIAAAIIAILAALLLPVLNGARSKALTISCASNEGQIGTALHGYIGDNTGYLPYGRPANTSEACLARKSSEGRRNAIFLSDDGGSQDNHYSMLMPHTTIRSAPMSRMSSLINEMHAGIRMRFPAFFPWSGTSFFQIFFFSPVHPLDKNGVLVYN